MELDGRHGDVGADLAGVVDGLQPQGLGAVAVVGEVVGQGPLVDRAEGGVTGADLSGDLGELLAGPERRRVLARTLGVGLAVLVPRHVRPVGGRVVREVAGLAVGQVADAALGGGEDDAGGRLGRVGLAGALAVVDPLEVAAADVRLAVLAGLQALRVVVRLLAVEVRHDVAVRVDDVVEVPAPGLGAVGVGEGRVVTGLARVVAVHRDGPGGVGLLLAAGVARQAVATEEVLGAVGRGDLPVLAVVVAVGGVGQLLDLGVVVPADPPLAGGVVLDDLAGGAAREGEGGVVVRPALVAVRVLLAVVGTSLVVALDEPGLVGEALADPGALVVGGRGLAVDRLGVVGEADSGLRAAGHGRGGHRVRPGERARGGVDTPLGGRLQARCLVVAAVALRARGGGQDGDRGGARGRGPQQLGPGARRVAGRRDLRGEGLLLRVVGALQVDGVEQLFFSGVVSTHSGYCARRSLEP